MMVRITYLFALLLFALVPAAALAHCPLCTAGAGFAVVIASYLGVSTVIIGIFIGAFAVALGLWLGTALKKQYIPAQKAVFAGFSFALTVLPLLPLVRDYTSFYLSLSGDYGSFLNRTYVLNKFFLGGLVGAAIMLVSPFVSGVFAALRRGRRWPYQGITITFALLLGVSLLVQFVV